MSSETSPQLLKIASSQISKAHGSTPMCFVPPESAAGTFLWVLHHIFTPTASQKLILRLLLSSLSLCRSNATAPKKISLLLASWKSAKTSKVFQQEAPNPTFPSRARPQHFFPLPGRRSSISWRTVCKRQP